MMFQLVAQLSKRRHDVPQATFETDLQDLTSMSAEPSVCVARRLSVFKGIRRTRPEGVDRTGHHEQRRRTNQRN